VRGGKRERERERERQREILSDFSRFHFQLFVRTTLSPLIKLELMCFYYSNYREL
jgi:hypothetical protein